MRYSFRAKQWFVKTMPVCIYNVPYSYTWHRNQL